ncbi:hypothetical protein [Dactylosporangium sp. NPDC051541]|uniref:hypothetical protein n=1 Tax=Dactylosporangium sp. NPDC051541 TaxID=3363977 RepID=UPI003791F94D
MFTVFTSALGPLALWFPSRVPDPEDAAATDDADRETEDRDAAHRSTPGDTD